jgi:hypothetical protein
MDWTVIIAKIVGIGLLALTMRSIVRHFRKRRERAQQAREPGAAQQARSEEFLNNIILYLWHAFMLAFSIGLVVNN